LAYILGSIDYYDNLTPSLASLTSTVIPYFNEEANAELIETNLSSAIQVFKTRYPHQEKGERG
jgi:hypothetical protein